MAQLFFLFMIPSLLVLSENLNLILNDSESAIESFGTSLQNWHKRLMFLNSYCYILSNITPKLQHKHLLHYLLLCAIYVSYTLSKWYTIFQYCLFIISICVYWCRGCSCFSNSCGFFRKYMYITIIA